MAGERSYVQVPPDSTGKKIRHEPFHRVAYNNRQLSHTWMFGQEYKVLRSAVDVFNGQTVTIFQGPDADAGYVGMKFPMSGDYNNLSLLAGDVIQYQISGVWTTVATVVSDEVIEIPYVHVSGGDAPHNTVNVDKTGSMNIRFSEGLPQLDAFGKLRTSQGTVLGEYQFTDNLIPRDISIREENEYSVVRHEDTIHCMTLEGLTGGQPHASVTTNTYHHYFPAQSQLSLMTVSCPNKDTLNVYREWGYMDERNGFGFRLDEGVLQVFVRSDANIDPANPPAETVIDQTEWNVDTADGSGDSQMTLDPENDNIYWIDVQWLGAGRIRFGTYHKGQRIVLHEHYSASPMPHSSYGSLPLNWHLHNRNGTNLTEDVIMRVWCATVVSEHSTMPNRHGVNNLETFTLEFDPNNFVNGDATSSAFQDSEYQMIGILSPVKNVGNSVHSNRTLYMPQYMEGMAYFSDTGEDASVEFEVYIDPWIGGVYTSVNTDNDTGAQAAGVSAQIPLVNINSLTGTDTVESYKHDLVDPLINFYGGGVHGLAQYLKGHDRADLTTQFSDVQSGAFKNYADNGGNRTNTIVDVAGAGLQDWSSSAGGILQFAVAGHTVKEGSEITFSGVSGSYGNGGASDIFTGQTFYMRIRSPYHAELYRDQYFQDPVLIGDYAGLDPTNNTHLSGGSMKSDYGQQMTFVIVCKPSEFTKLRAAQLATLAADASAGRVSNGGLITVNFNLGWKEIQQ